MNLLAATVRLTSAVATDWGTALSCPKGPLTAQIDHKVTLGVRPDKLSLVLSDQAQANGEVTLVEHLGDETILQVQISGGTPSTLKLSGDVMVRFGARVDIGFDLIGASLFGAAGLRIGT